MPLQPAWNFDGSYPIRRLNRRLLLLLAAIPIAFSSARAQEYAVDEVNDRVRVQHGGKLQRWVGNPTVYAAEKATFDEFFDTYYFPAMTRHGPDDLAALGDMRHNLFRRVLWATRNEQLQRDLTVKAFNAMKDIVEAQNPPYHPAVRYNAILVLGMLDAQYAIDAGASSRPPRPLPGATRLLTTVVDSAIDDDGPYPSAIVLGALIGLERHARHRDSLPPALIEPMSDAALKIVERDEPLREMDRQASMWLQLRAASVLGNLGSVGPDNRVHNALVKLVGEGYSLDERCAAAALLARLDYEDVEVDGAATLGPLLMLARDLAAEEDKRAQDFQDAQLGGGGFTTRPRERFAGAGACGEQASFPRRHLLARLANLRAGLRAVRPALTEEEQTTIDAVLEAIAPAIKAASDQATVDLALTRTIRTMADEVIHAAALREEHPVDLEEAAT